MSCFCVSSESLQPTLMMFVNVSCIHVCDELRSLRLEFLTISMLTNDSFTYCASAKHLLYQCTIISTVF